MISRFFTTNTALIHRELRKGGAKVMKFTLQFCTVKTQTTIGTG